MDSRRIVAVVLICVGIMVLAYSGITFTTPGKPIDFLGIHIETTVRHFIPPAVGAVALAGGLVLLALGYKKS